MIMQPNIINFNSAATLCDWFKHRFPEVSLRGIDNAVYETPEYYIDIKDLTVTLTPRAPYAIQDTATIQEEAHYYQTLANMLELVDLHGEDKIMKDFYAILDYRTHALNKV